MTELKKNLPYSLAVAHGPCGDLEEEFIGSDCEPAKIYSLRTSDSTNHREEGEDGFIIVQLPTVFLIVKKYTRENGRDGDEWWDAYELPKMVEPDMLCV